VENITLKICQEMKKLRENMTLKSKNLTQSLTKVLTMIDKLKIKKIIMKIHSVVFRTKAIVNKNLKSTQILV
jgi:hypothetical protein